MGRARAPWFVPPCLVIPLGEWRRPAVYNVWRAHTRARQSRSARPRQ